MKRSIFAALLCMSSLLQAQVYEYNTQQLGQWNGAGEIYSDIWGYAAGGREYAILGSAQYIYFFEVTNPANIRLVDKFGPFTSTSWREFKTYGHYAYAVTDGPDAGGLRIFDLQYLPDTVIQVRQTTAFFSKCHMTFIDEANGRMYCAGTNTQNNGIIVLNLATRPDSPSVVINQALPRGYVHDMYVKNNVMYASHIYAGYLSQYNCAGNSCSGEISTYQTGGYNHSSWMNDNQTLMINAIETAGHPLWLFPINNGMIGGENVKKFKSVTLRDQYPNQPVGDTGSIGHNPYIIGNYAYVSYYTDGVQIYNISDVNNVRRVAYFDTDRGYTSYSPVFRGCWGTYPFLPSGNILASDIQSGLWVFKTTACAQSQPPTISINTSSPSYPWGSSFTINAVVNDPDGSIAKVEFYNGNVLLGTATSTPFNHVISSANSSTYNIIAKVFDNCGMATNSSVLNITTTSSCSDEVQNGNELGVDCGGTCPSCLPACVSSVLLSQGKSTNQSSTLSANYSSSKLTDGSSSSFNHTLAEAQPWWEVDLGEGYQVASIEITNRVDCCGDRLKRFKVFVSLNPITTYTGSGTVYEFNNPNGAANGQVITIPNINIGGRYVRIWVDNTGYGNNPLHLGEVKVMGCCLNVQNPTVSIGTSASSYPQGSSFTVTAEAGDPGGISKVEFYNDGNLLSTDPTAPYNHVINLAGNTPYHFTAKAYNNCNGVSTTSPLTINTTTACNDGFQNGTETGIDCGGSCNACPQNCIANTNLSQGKTATQSSTYSATYAASKLVDGITNNLNHTNNELQPWWQVDLGSNYQISTVEITNRPDCCGNRLKRFKLFISNSEVGSYSGSGSVYEYNNPTGPNNGQLISIPNINVSGRYVRIWMDNTGYGNNPLHLAEVKVLGCSNNCQNNQSPAVSINTTSSTYPNGSSFTINATATDPGGSIAQVEFYDGNTLLSIDNEAPYSHTVNPAIQASYNLTAKAIDNCNSSTTSNNIIVSTTTSCSDGYRNGTETGVDCGGSCSACAAGCTSTTNISQGKAATQSSTYSAAHAASKLVDGISNNLNHTNNELQPWWQVDLGSSYQIASINITNRSDCCGNRLKRFKVFVSNSEVSSYAGSGSVYEYNNSTGASNGQIINIPNINLSGRYVRIWMDNTGYGNNPLHLAEVRVMGCTLSTLIEQTPAEITSRPPSYSTPAQPLLKLFPNPSEDWINLQFNVQPEAGVLVKIYDLQGRLLSTETVIDYKFSIARFESGTYIVRIQDKDNMYVHKIIKL